LVAFASLACGCAAASSSTTAATSPKLTQIGKFSNPLFVTQPPADRSRLFIVEQRGKIRLMKAGHLRAKPFLDVSGLISCCSERGLLGLAFAPDYATSRRFYIDYTDTSGNTRVVEYRRSLTNADVADAAHPRVVLTQVQPEQNHNGGEVTFGPDGKLYIGLGDGGGGNDQHGLLGNAQNLGTLLGKILRIDPLPAGGAQYTSPPDNPFVGTPGARPEIWAYGLRNPWRFSFDRKTGGLAIGDVGQDAVEEIDWSAAPTAGKGLNFGWRPFEGTRANFPGESAPNAVPPVAQYEHSTGGCSVTGGYVMRDPRLPRLAGRYLYGDLCTGRISMASLHEGRLAAISLGQLPFKVSLLASFGQDSLGHIYVVSLQGPVYRLDP
jgi:glucose/arabinose dehydrogenase